jgi:SAM-dependent methyltransferase
MEHRGRLLEFGSGKTFPITTLVGGSFREVCATDIEDVPPSQWPAGVTFKRCTLTTIPFDTNQFDAVMVRSVIEHVAEPDRVFSELGRVLKPGGMLFMNLPNKWDYVSVIAMLAGRWKSRLLRQTLDPQWADFPVLYRANTRGDVERAIKGTNLVVDHFYPLASEPAYLSFFVPFYVLGAVYQFLISLFLLDFLQPAFLVVIRKVR